MGVIELIAVRHGESTGNVAREEAEARGAEVIAVEARDADVGLTGLGQRQAQCLGRFLRSGTQPMPTAIWTSPYVRASQTAQLVAAAAELDAHPRLDERLRDRELGILDTLTTHGFRSRYPLEEMRRTWQGKFYYRPPGGESWADVGLRLRSVLPDIDRLEDGGRVMLVTHDAVIAMLRYVCEELSEAQVLGLARNEMPVNTGVTRLRRDGPNGYWRAVAVNQHDHLLPDFAGADLRTRHPADPAQPPAGTGTSHEQ